MAVNKSLFNKVVSFEKKLIFLTPAKCSTYSLENFLIKNNVKLETPYTSLSTPFYHPTLSEIVYSYNIPLNSLSEYKIIQIVRNPKDRLISSYFHDIKNVGSYIPFSIFLTKLESSKYLLPYHTDEFVSSFYNNISYKWRFFQEGSWGGIRHYYNQSLYLNINHSLNFKYFKLEDVKNSTEELSKHLNVENIQYPLLNTSKFLATPLYQEFLKDYKNTENVKERIFNLFKEDYKMFNYKCG